MRIVGIDPGANGAIAFIDSDDPYFKAAVWDLPRIAKQVDVRQVIELLKRIAPGMMVLEQQQSFPGQGVQSAFVLGVEFGQLDVLCRLYTNSYHLVRPARWKAALGLNREKEASRAMAQRLWPTLAEHVLARVRDEGRAEALLIAEYGRRFLLGTSQPSRE